MPIKTTEEKNKESLTMVKASSSVRRNARHVKELIHLENLHQQEETLHHGLKQHALHPMSFTW